MNNYPHFKKISIDDKDAIVKHTASLLPNSDFLFSNIVIWGKDSKGVESEYSILNNNLVLLIPDLIGEQKVITLAGYNDLTRTVKTLLKDYNAIHYIPEKIASKFPAHYTKVEDPASKDYIFDLSKLSNLSGQDFSERRKEVNEFKRLFPQVTIKPLDLSSVIVQADILDLTMKWKDNKKQISILPSSLDIEISAIQKFMENSTAFHYIAIGFYDGEKIIGYTIHEVIDGLDTVIGHFAKGDITYKGIFSYMYKISSDYLLSLGYKYINHQSDMGLEGLRQTKERWKPVYYLKKYSLYIPIQ